MQLLDLGKAMSGAGEGISREDILLLQSEKCQVPSAGPLVCSSKQFLGRVVICVSEGSLPVREGSDLSLALSESATKPN